MSRKCLVSKHLDRDKGYTLNYIDNIKMNKVKFVIFIENKFLYEHLLIVFCHMVYQPIPLNNSIHNNFCQVPSSLRIRLTKL